MTLQIIDTHQHLWDLQTLSLPWVENIPELNRSFNCQDYGNYTRPNQDSELKYEISQTLYMEVDVAESDIPKETNAILQLCYDESNPMVGLIAAARPEFQGFASSIDFAKSNPEIKGFRRVLHTESTPPKTCLRPEFISSLQTLARHDLTFDLCMRREELSDVVELASQCANTQFILDHCGNADARMTSEEYSSWKADIQAIAKCENVVCKVSGFVWTIQNPNWRYETAIAPILEAVFESFGEDRVLFGGDWPVCTLSQLTFSQWVEAIHKFSRDFGENTPDKLFKTNAARVYRIGQP